jgi:hypothetical protein
MKKIIKSILFGSIFFSLFYLVGSFGNHNFDISFWSEISLVCVSLFGGVFSLFLIIIIFCSEDLIKDVKHDLRSSKASRFEVIDHSRNLEQGEARVFSKKDCKSVDISYQDDGKTIKIFLK